VDPGRMVQIISNLLNNASKFTPREGSISITASRQGNEAVIAIKDTGIGIAAEHLTGIFEVFFQCSNSSTQPNSGLGIGLSLASALVSMHGGTIEARSEGLGTGSEFLIHLPLAEARTPGFQDPTPRREGSLRG